ncbi:tripartite tricarboxylate transporter substrate-binding protein [Roseomonas sp. E05]|uniref:Bug family tripartite tricarboxylate transporter substrate binding protein n=1 Tax=Roseomonas sp. E05 TaxID=3046310 RepID=UPI0024BA1A5B|nr:tripartite tricarboxylate transporter substrate-binding protein [Roseomonas sp. E05]MDJ0389238.1 tripartite tricarboxylate transporter substrate-binding protein [Roseomonas sp. E05]
MKPWTRRAVVAAMGALPAIRPGAAAEAGNWPSETIRIVVPFAPGGSTDAAARLVAPGLQQRLGVPIIVENRSGAAGSIGADVVAKAKPDGYTWLLTFDSHALMPILVPSLPFDLEKDLDPVTQIGRAPYVTACQPSKPYRSMEDVFAAARKGPVSFGSTGNGTIGHLVMLMMAQRKDVEITHLPYRSGGLAVNDAVAGHVDMMIGSAALLASQISGGTLRPLMQFGSKRLPALPDVPTATESGFPDLTAEAWWGVFAPAGVPAPILARFQAAVIDAYREPRIARQFTEVNQAELVLGDAPALAKFVESQIRIWGEVARANHVRPD